MKSPGQTYQKMKQARFRHVKREIENLLKQTSRNCTQNTQARSTTGSIGICKLDCQTCDPQVQDRSETCGKFTQTHGREDVKKSLQDFFSLRTIPEIAVRYPDVAALLWVLDGEELEGEELPGGREDYFPGSILGGTYNGVKVWVDSEEEAKNFTSSIQNMVSLQEIILTQRGEIDSLRENLSKASSQNQSLQEDCQKLQDLYKTSESLWGILEDSVKRATESWATLLRERSERIAVLEREVEKALEREVEKALVREVESINAMEVPLPFWKRMFR